MQRFFQEPIQSESNSVFHLCVISFVSFRNYGLLLNTMIIQTYFAVETTKSLALLPCLDTRPAYSATLQTTECQKVLLISNSIYLHTTLDYLFSIYLNLVICMYMYEWKVSSINYCDFNWNLFNFQAINEIFPRFSVVNSYDL